MVTITVQNVLYAAYVAIRPYAYAFRTVMANHYEMLMATASAPEYRNALVGIVDPKVSVTLATNAKVSSVGRLDGGHMRRHQRYQKITRIHTHSPVHHK